MLLQSTTAGSFSDQRLSLWSQIKFEPHPVWSPLGVYFEDPRPFPMGVAPGISWSGKWTGFRERSSGKTVSFFQGASHAPRALSTAMSFVFPWMSKKNSKYAKYFFVDKIKWGFDCMQSVHQYPLILRHRMQRHIRDLDCAAGGKFAMPPVVL